MRTKYFFMQDHQYPTIYTHKFKGKYRIPSARLPKWNYGANGIYFITICTKNQRYYFGKIRDKTMILSKIGRVAQRYWEDIPQHFPDAQLDKFVIMPNHIHGIIIINKSDFNPCWQANTFDPQKRNLASMIRGFKSGVKKYATIHEINFTWQASFHDNIIRSPKELENIQKYIINNPIKWSRDRNH